MTYIIAGKIDNVKFLLADCIGHRQDESGRKSYTFAEKIKRLSSSPGTFFTMTGSAYISQLLEMYDTWLHSQNITIDFSSEKFMRDFLKFVDFANTHDNQAGEKLEHIRLFFLSEKGVFFCDFGYSNDRRLTRRPIMNEVENKTYVSSNLGRTLYPIGEEAKNLNKSNLREYCMNEMKELAYGDPGADFFSNRTQFILLDGTKEDIVESAYKYPSDILAYYFGIPYSQLDTPEFILHL